MKTIRMPKELLTKWLAALRSGEYKQGHRYLQNEGGYCCLGVLQLVADGDVERDGAGHSTCLPSEDWMNRKGVEFSGSDCPCAPWLPLLNDRADWANDGGAPFPKIADAIEACAEGY